MPRPTINDVATCGRRLEGCGLLRAERPARPRPGHPGPDPGGRRRARLDTQPPGPRALGVQGPRRRPRGRPAARDPPRRRVLPLLHLRPRGGAVPARPRPAADGRRARRRRDLPPARQGGPRRRRLRHRPPGRRPAARAARPSSACRPSSWARACASDPPDARHRRRPRHPRRRRAPRRPRDTGTSRTCPAPSRWCTAAPAVRRGPTPCARRGCPRASASRRTSPPSRGPPPPRRCSTSPSRRPRSSSPTT